MGVWPLNIACNMGGGGGGEGGVGLGGVGGGLITTMR